MADNDPKCIMVVDDEPHICDLIKSELEEDGYKVVTISDSEKVLDTFQELHPDVLSLDIRMPGMDGLDVLSRIREIDMQVPIIILTAYSSYKQDFSVWGADAYIVKSMDLSEYKNAITEILKR
jgi:two-component system, response regulator, stage 0 sporulation protein F